MNKNYRVVWSDARQAFIAVSENTNSKRKPKSSVRSAVALAVGALFLAPAAAFAVICPTTTTISSALTNSQCYDNNENVTVTSTGSVSVTNTNLAPAGIYTGNPYGGVLTNNGTISSAIMGTGAPGYTVSNGIRIDNTLTGSIVNAGTIDSMATHVPTGGNGSPNAFGISTGNVAVGASIVNTGTIRAQTAGSDMWVVANQATGIATSDVYGTVANSGTISAAANATASDYVNNNATGVSLGTVRAGGSFTNTGTISTSAVSMPGTAYAYATNAYGVTTSDIEGTFSNAGRIEASATIGAGGTQGYTAVATGISLQTIAVTGRFMNTGSISAVGLSSGDLYGYANGYGVTMSSLNGMFSNAGSISAAATGAGIDYANVEAYGVQVNGDMAATGSFINTGTITASATASAVSGNNSSYAYAYGVSFGNNVYGSFTNTGSIGATAVSSQPTAAYTEANAYGVYLYSAQTSTFANSGSISASATATNLPGGPSAANAYGTYMSQDVNGTVGNSGSITATATATSASAYGLYINSNLNGTLTNTGTIRGTANVNGGGATAVGVYVGGNLDGTINNSGTIAGNLVGTGGMTSAYSISAGSGSGTINNMAGGVLDGALNLGGSVNVVNNGLIDSRPGPSFMTGNYTQGATGTFRLTATNNTTFGGLSVGGTATFAPGTTLSLAGTAGHTLAAGTLSSVVTSGGLTMSTVNVVDNVLSLNYAAVQNGNNIDLVATQTGLTSVAAATGGSGGTAGGALDALLADISNQPQQIQQLLQVLGSQTTQQGVLDTVRKIQPLLVTSTTQAGVGASQGVGGTVLARLENIQGRSAGDRFLGDRKVWLKPFGSWASQDDRNGVVGYDARTAGLVGGVDGDVGDFRLGAAFGYARSTIDGNSSAAPQTARVDSYQFMLYGSRSLGQATDVNFQAGFGLHDNNSRRTINLGGTSVVANGDYGAVSANVGAGLAHTIKWGERTSLTPSLRFDYTTIRNRSYNETGAGALNLNVGTNDLAKFIVAADGKLVHQFSDRAKFAANLGVGYDFINERGSVTSAFAGAPQAAFSTQGIQQRPWLLRGGLGMTYRATEQLEVTGRYDIEARSGFTNQTASVNFRLPF